MKDLLNRSIINTFIEIKKIIDNIIYDNVVFSIKKNDYIKCINLLYNILIDTLKKIENIYYHYILLPKLQNYNQSTDINIKLFQKENLSLSCDKNTEIYNIILTTLIYNIIN